MLSTTMGGGERIENTGSLTVEGRGAGGSGSVIELVRRWTGKHPTLVRFFAVGVLGYAIYVGLLFAIYDLNVFAFLPNKETSVDLLLFSHGDALLLVATVIATQVSITAVFIAHQLWTFADRTHHKTALWVRFLQFEAKALISILGILTVVVNVIALGAGVHPIVAVPAGMVLAFICNWLIDSRLIWASRVAADT